MPASRGQDWREYPKKRGDSFEWDKRVEDGKSGLRPRLTKKREEKANLTKTRKKNPEKRKKKQGAIAQPTIVGDRGITEKGQLGPVCRLSCKNVSERSRRGSSSNKLETYPESNRKGPRLISANWGGKKKHIRNTTRQKKKKIKKLSEQKPPQIKKKRLTLKGHPSANSPNPRAEKNTIR